MTKTKTIFVPLDLPGAYTQYAWPALIDVYAIQRLAGPQRILIDSSGSLTFGANPGTAHLQEQILNQLVDARIDSGDSFVLAINALSTNTFRWLRRLKEKAWGYQIVFVDTLRPRIRQDGAGFIADELAQYTQSGLPTDVHLAERMPKYVRRYQNTDFEQIGPVISRAEFDQLVHEPLRLTKLEPDVARIVVCSDVHGDVEDLQALIGRYDDGLTQMFCLGDLIDRGPDSAGVIRTLLAHPEIKVAAGNHEHRLLSYYAEGRACGTDFIDQTLPQLQAARITSAEIQTLFDRLESYFALNFAGKQLLLTHAGIEPAQVAQWQSAQEKQHGPLFAPFDSFTHGLGTADGNSVYARDIDQVIADDVGGFVQVHGHRNRFKRTVTKKKQTAFNLTDADGSTFRYLVLNADGQYEMHLVNRTNSDDKVIRGQL